MSLIPASLALCMAIAGTTASAQQTHATARARPVSDFTQLSQAAGAARDQGRSEVAIRLYRQALTIQPKWKDGLWSMSSLFYASNQYADARDSERRLLAIDHHPRLPCPKVGMSQFEIREYSRSLHPPQPAIALRAADHEVRG